MVYARALALLALLSTPAQAQYFSSPPFPISNFVVPNAATVMGNWNRFISDGNTTFNALAGEIVAMPAHAVMPFNLAACPSGWSAANGSGGTIDLRGYFIATATSSIGTASGDLVPQHQHTTGGTYQTGFTGGGNQLQVFSTAFFVTGSGGTSVGNMASGNVATETRPKNVALLMCEKN